MAKLTNHPYADLFPLMTAAELDALAEDIKENGLRHPVVLYKGQVIKSGDKTLAHELEANGYADIIGAAA